MGWHPGFAVRTSSQRVKLTHCRHSSSLVPCQPIRPEKQNSVNYYVANPLPPPPPQYSIRRCISQSSGRWKIVALCPWWYLTRYCDKTSWTETAHIWNSNINSAINESIMGFDWSIFLGLFHWHRDNSTIAAVPVNSLEGHGMMTSSNGNIFRVTGLLCEEFTGNNPSQRPATRNFDVFFDLHMNKRLSKQPRPRWFETPSSSLWRHCNG